MRIHLHLLSDSTGETVSTVARASVSQFDELQMDEHAWSFVRTVEQVDRILEIVEALPGPIFFTILEENIRNHLEAGAARIGVKAVSVLDTTMSAISLHTGRHWQPRIGRQHAMDDDYFTRIEAMNFMLRHDDGMESYGVLEADVVIFGVSRTSKTPTSIYLANRGLKVANIPVVPEIPLPADVAQMDKQFAIGLSISPETLLQIRENRVRQMQAGSGTHLGRGKSYTDIDRIREEVKFARQLYRKNGWPDIDVTRRSVEETAAEILQLYRDRQDASQVNQT